MRPSTVSTAFWLYVAGAAVGVVSVLVGAIVGIGLIQSGQLPGALPPGSPEVSPGLLNAALAVGVTIGIVVGLLSVVAYVLFAVPMRRGANWARIVLTVLSSIAFVSGLAGLIGPGPNLLNLLVSVIVVVAAVLMYVPASNAYFAARTAARVPQQDQ
jgi:hypothetical protein